MISLCVLSYNRKDFLRESIETALAGAEEPFELIVHDDGSTEPGLREYLTGLINHGRISHLILNPPGHNEGQGIALNRLFFMAKGSIICKADHDLVYKPGWDRAIRDVIEANEHTRARYDTSPVPRIGALGLFKYPAEPVRFEDMLISERASVGVPWYEVKDFVGSFMAIPRRVFYKFGPFEERSPAFAEDAVWKQTLAKASDWCNALTYEDYVVNQGFGVGPSTLVEGFEEDGTTGILAKIKNGPKRVGGRR